MTSTGGDERSTRATRYVQSLTPTQVWRWSRAAIGEPGDPARAAVARLLGDISIHQCWTLDSDGWSGGGRLAPALRTATQSLQRAATKRGPWSSATSMALIGVLLDYRAVLDQWCELSRRAAAQQIRPPGRVAITSGTFADLREHRIVLLGSLTKLLDRARDLRNEATGLR